MGFLLVLLICTPIFAVVGKSEELLSGFSNNYGREEQVRMETEAEGIRETFLKGAYEQELKNQVQGILRKEGIFSAKTEVDMEKELQLTITLYGTVTEKQREAVKNELERICGYKNGYVMWPLRTAVSGKQMTPAGATEIMEIIGKEETLKRVHAAIEKLENK